MKNFAILLTLIVMFWSMGAHAQSAAAKPDSAPQGNADSGKKLYLSHGCWSCHGYAAQGGTMNENPTGPRLAGRVAPWPAFSKYVRHPAGNMIPYTEKVISDHDLADIHAWLRSLPPPPPVSSLSVFKDKD